jgi:fumarate reductase subunit C
MYEANQGGRKFFDFFYNVSQTAWVRVYLLVSLVFVCYHSITSFMAAPTIIAPRWGEDKIDPRLIIWAHFLLWFVLSLGILILVLSK